MVDAIHTVSLKQMPSMSDGRYGGTYHTGSNPVLTTMNKAVELITQRNADNGD